MMKNIFFSRNSFAFTFLLFLLLGLCYSGWGQTTIYSENFGTGNTSPTGWSTSGQDNWTISNVTSSSGYTGASGGNNAESPSKNNQSGTLYSKSISTVGYTNVSVLWAARMPTYSSISPTLEWFDGVIWTSISFTDIGNTSTWGLVNGGVRISLPPSASNLSNLQFRWYIYDSRSNYKIDDFSVQGCQLPSQPTTISGSTTPCQASSQIYIVTNDTGVTYIWAFPAGWTQTAGGTTNSVTVTVGAGSGNISVTPSNGCGNGTARTLGVTVNPISVGGTISGGSSPICQGTSTGTLTLSGYTGTIVRWERRVNSGGWSSVGNGGNASYSEIPYSAGTWEYRAVVKNGICPEANSSEVTIVVDLKTVGGGVYNGNTPICMSSSTGTMNLGGGYVGNVVRWEKRVDGGAWANISNTLTTYSETPSLAGTWEYRALVQSGSCPSEYSNAFSVVVNPVLTITLGSNPEVCQTNTLASLPYSSTTGNPTHWIIVFDATAISAGFESPQNNNLSSAPGNIPINIPYSVAAGVYNATLKLITYNPVCSSVDYPITITVTSPPSAPTGLASQSFCASSNPTVADLTATGTTVQWYSNSSGGSALATTTALVNGTHYFASQTVGGCESTSRFDVTATVNPNSPVSVSVAVSANPVCAGTFVTFTAFPTNGGTTLAYQWKVNGVNAGTNSEIYSYSPENNDAITVEMTSNATCATGSPAISNTVSMIVNPNLPASVSIAAAPSGAICAGTSVTFTATPTNGGATPTYQWYKSASPISGETGSTYTSTTLAQGDVITVEMTSTATCATGSPATSNGITMTVNPNLPASVSIAASPSGAICAGTSVTFTATPTNGGTTPTYQWYNGANPISGATSATYTSTTLANGNAISVRMTSNATCATGSPATSNTVTMIVNPNLPVSVSIAAAPSGAICAGTSVTFTASPSNGGTTPTYIWKKGGVAISPAETGATYTTTTLAQGDVITVEMTSNATCVTGSPATSSAITITVYPTSIGGTVTAPSSQLCYNTSTTLTLAGSFGAIQWQQSADGINGWANVTGGSGATTASYTTPNLITKTYYRAQTTSGICSSSFSNSVEVGIDTEKPIISNCPANISVPVTDGLCSAVVSWAEPTASDNCTLTSFVSNLSPGATIAVGTSTVIYTATDNSGNVEICSFTITVTDNIAPDITCPAGSTVFCVVNAPVYSTYTEFTTAGGSASDNCNLNESSFTQLTDVISGSTLTRTYQIEDMAGNINSCSQVFTISQPAVTIESLGLNNTCIGEILDITSNSTGLNYQWQVSSDNGGSWITTGSNSASYTGTLIHQGDQYRLLVSETTNFNVGCVATSNVLVFKENTPPVFIDGTLGNQIICTANGATSAAVSYISLTNSNVTDNCTEFVNLVLSYSISGDITESGTNPAEGKVFNLGTYTINYSVTDQAGLVSTHSLNLIVKQSPSPIAISHSVVSGGGSGIAPNQCGTYNYSVDGGIADPLYTYQWNVYAGGTAIGTPISTYSGSALNQITWSGDLAPGAYTIEAIKKAGNDCESKATLVIDLQNSFDLQVQSAGQDCKGEVTETTPFTITWTVDKLCGTENWGFTYYLFAQDINTLPANYLTVNDGAGSFTGITNASHVFNTAVINGNPYLQTVYTLFIVNTNDSNAANDYNKFYLKGIPETSPISTD